MGDPPVSFAILTANEKERKAVNHFLKLGDPITADFRHAIGRMCSDDAVLQDAGAKLECHANNSKNLYPAFYLDVEGKRQKGVHVSCNTMGPWGALDKIVDLLKTAKDEGWKLQYIFLVGCCGASVKVEENKQDKEKEKRDREHECPRGTILLAKQVKDYLSTGKVKDGVVSGTPVNQNVCYEMLSEWEAVREANRRDPQRIEVKVVNYLTGPLVIKDDLFGAAYCEAHAEVTGVEMEVVGVIKAAETFHQITGEPLVNVVLAKGVSDYTSGKGERGDCKFFGEDIKDLEEDALQVYATLQSVALVIRFVAKNMQKIFK